MPGVNFDPSIDFAKRISDIERKIGDIETRDVLQNASIGSNGLLVYGGGSITIQDGGSIVVTGTGTISLPTGTLSAGALSISGNGTVGGILDVGELTGGAVFVTGNITSTGGTVAAGANVTAGGQVISAGVINSPGTRANTVTVGYQSLWADSSGNFGANTSSRRDKRDITPTVTDIAGVLGLQTYTFRYKAAVDEIGAAARVETGLVAEEVVEVAEWACFYEEDGTTVRGVNYDRLTVALLNIVQDQQRRIAALEAK